MYTVRTKSGVEIPVRGEGAEEAAAKIAEAVGGEIIVGTPDEAANGHQVDNEPKRRKTRKTAEPKAPKSNRRKGGRQSAKVEAKAPEPTEETLAVSAWLRGRKLPQHAAEVVGAWVWVTFPAKPNERIRKALTERGFRFNRRRSGKDGPSVWQHPCGVHSRRAQDGSDPRQKYNAVPLSALENN